MKSELNKLPSLSAPLQSMNPSSNPTQYDLLPPDDQQRTVLHNHVHARPSQRIRLPALIVYLAVLNDDVILEEECEHLRRLPGQEMLSIDQLQNNFLRLRMRTTP